MMKQKIMIGLITIIFLMIQVTAGGIYSPKLSTSKKVKELGDEAYNVLLDSANKYENGDASIDRIDIDPELATFLDDDSVSYEADNGKRIGVRFSSLSAIESVDKENEYIAILNDESSTMAEKIEANKKITELGLEKKGTSEALKTFNSEIRANYDVVAINPELDNEGKIQFDVYNRQLAKDAVLRNKITGREQSYVELMVMGGFTVDGNNIAGSGSELSRIEKNRNISQQEYFGIKNNIELVASNHIKDYENIANRELKVLRLLNSKVQNGEYTTAQSDAVYSAFKKRHEREYGSPKAKKIYLSDAYNKIEKDGRDKQTGEYDIPKLMDNFDRMAKSGVKPELTEEMEKQVYDYFRDEYGSLKGGVNGSAKDKAKLAEINGFLKAFSTAGYKTKNGVKKSKTKQLNDLSVRGAVSIDENKLYSNQKQVIDNQLNIFESVSDWLGSSWFGSLFTDNKLDNGMSYRETAIADIEDQALKNKLDPYDLIDSMGKLSNPIRGNIWVKHWHLVNVDNEHFVHYKSKSATLIKDMYYDEENAYLIVRLNHTYYHYCSIPKSVIDEWRNMPKEWDIRSPLKWYYYNYIKGNYDCRINPVPSYE